MADGRKAADHVAVIGGGIGGLTTALALLRRGIDCVVYERADELREIGAGVGVWPGPLAVFDSLGVGEAVRSLSAPWKTAGLRRSDGTYLVRYDAERFARRLGECTVGVHRGELQTLLRSELPDETLMLGAEVMDLRQDGEGVTLELAGGATARARAVIGADGIRSRTRELLFGRVPLRDARTVGWRGTADPAPAEWGEFAGESWGPDARFGVLPIAGRVTWYAAAARFQGDGGLGEVRERFGHWHHPIPQLIEATTEARLWRDELYDHRPLRRWSQGRVTLLGDAAHAMTPDLGQGACQAILDAAAVARALATHHDPQEAFDAYERARRRRARIVSSVAHAATSGARINGAALAVRSAVVRAVPPELMLRGLHVLARG